MAHESRRMPTWLVDHSSQTDSESGCMTITMKCDPVFPSDESLECCTYAGWAIPKSQYDGCILHSSVYFANINQRFVIKVLDISFLPPENTIHRQKQTDSRWPSVTIQFFLCCQFMLSGSHLFHSLFPPIYPSVCVLDP